MNEFSKRIKNIADRAALNGSKSTESLYKIAEDLSTYENLYNNNMGNFDPSMPDVSMEPNGVNVQSFANENPEESADSNVPIESFIKINQDNPTVPNDYVSHSCSVLFKAPKDIEESEMMNYILGIGEQLGVEVQKFEWEKLEPKENKK